MISLIKHVVRTAHSLVREHIVKKNTRSHEWPKVRKEILKKEANKCACCGSTTLPQVHHIKPFHLDPALELDPKNLVVLCMGTNECHLLIGHGDNFKKYNPYLMATIKSVQSGAITLKEAQEASKKAAIL